MTFPDCCILAMGRTQLFRCHADYVPALLDRARERAAAERLAIKFREADAGVLPFADACCDIVVSTFGVMFTPDQERAAAKRQFVFRYRSPEHWPQVFKTFYDPVLKAFDALEMTAQAALQRELSHQIGGFLGAWLVGKAFEATGGYDWIWRADIALCLLAALVHLPIREARVGQEMAQVA